MDKLIIITGPTASGKSGLGIQLAKKYNGEIVSADSRQVYTGLDIGSGKVTAEEMQGIPHYLLDAAMPNDFFSLFDFQQQAYAAIDDIISRNKKAFLVGGTGLYVNAVADGYHVGNSAPDLKLRKELNEKTLAELIDIIKINCPEMLDRVDLKNKQRVERAAEKALLGDTGISENTPRYGTLVLGCNWPRPMLYERIRKRLDMRLADGMIDEVINLRKNGATDEFLYKLGLEYRYVLMYLRNEFESFDAFYDKLFMEIRHLAKEQMTWFRKRKDIIWIDFSDTSASPEESAVKYIDSFLSDQA